MINSIKTKYLRTLAFFQTKFRYQDHMPMSDSHLVFSSLCLYLLHTLKWLWVYRYIMSKDTYHFSILYTFWKHVLIDLWDVISFSLLSPRNSFCFSIVFAFFWINSPLITESNKQKTYFWVFAVFQCFCIFLWSFLPLKCKK